MLHYLKKKVPVVENAWTIDGKIHCSKKRPPAERDCRRKIYTIDTPDDLLKLGVATRLILRNLVLQTCFAFRNPVRM